MKTLYTFKANKKEKVEEQVTNEDGSITIKKVDKFTPVEVYLKQPSRRDREDLAVVYNSEYGKALSKGIQSFDSLRKAVLDNGGMFAKQDLERADDLIRLIQHKSNEVQLYVTEGKPIDDLEREIQDLTNEYAEYEKPKTALYAKSAEYEAKKNTIVWAVLNFTFTKNQDYEYVFPGATYESRLNHYYDCCDNDSDFEKEAFDKAYVCFHHHIEGNEVSKEYFDALLDDSVEE